jgi:hypothetical protein
MADLHWQCQLNHLAEGDQPGPQLASDALTVGEKFLLSCEGSDVTFDPAALSLEMPKEQQYDLKLLKNLGVASHKASFVATSYVASEKPIEFKNIFLSDGKSRVALDGLSLNVKTVITQQNNPKNEAFGPLGPLAIAYPIWFWLSFGVLFSYLIFLIVDKVSLRLDRRAFLNKLAANPPVLSPYHQLTKELRVLSREAQAYKNFDSEAAAKFWRDLDLYIRWYLSRSFEFSCFEIHSYEILFQLKIKNPDLEKKVTHSLSRVLIEMERLENRTKLLKFEDTAQLIEMVRLAADEIQKNSHSKAANTVSRVKLEAGV